MPYLAAERAALPFRAPANAEWVGKIMLCSRAELLPREEARRRLRLPAEGKVVLVNIGGGGNPAGERLVETVLRVAPDFPDVSFALTDAPLRDASATPAARDNLLTVAYFPMAECLAAFDAAISSVGHSSWPELVHAGIPTIWVPLDYPSTDQHHYARWLVEQGLGLCPTPFEASGMRDALERLLEPELAGEMARRMRATLPENGADRAAELISRKIAERSEAGARVPTAPVEKPL